MFPKIPFMLLSATLSLDARRNLRNLFNMPSPPVSLEFTISMDKPTVFISQVIAPNLDDGGWFGVRSAFLV